MGKNGYIYMMYKVESRPTKGAESNLAYIHIASPKVLIHVYMKPHLLASPTSPRTSTLRPEVSSNACNVEA